MATNEDEALRARIRALTPEQRRRLRERLAEENKRGWAKDVAASTARGLSDAGHTAAAGALDLVGADKKAANVRASREHAREFYGKSETLPGKIAGVVARGTGEAALFLAPGAVAGRIAKGVGAVRGVRAIKAGSSVAADALIEAGETPEESLVGTVAELTDSEKLRGVSRNTGGRAAGGVAAGAVLGEFLKLGGKGLKAAKGKLTPGSKKAAAQAQQQASAVGDVLDEAEAPGKTRVSDVEPKLDDRDFENVLDHVSDPEHMERTKARVSRLKTGEPPLQGPEIEGYARSGEHGGYNRGEIDAERAARLGTDPAPIRVTRAVVTKVFEKHGEQLRAAGFRDEDDLFDRVGELWEDAKPGGGGRLVLWNRGDPQGAIVVNLESGPAGPHHNVETGYPASRKGGRWKKGGLLGEPDRRGISPSAPAGGDPADLSRQRPDGGFGLTGSQQPPPPRTPGVAGGSGGAPRLLNEPTTEAATLEAARGVDVDGVLKKHGFEMLTGPESQALRIEFGLGTRKLVELETRLAHMAPDDPAREQLELAVEQLGSRQDALLERHVKGGSAVGRALRLRRLDHELAAKQTLDPLTWFTRARRELGPQRELTNEMKARIRTLIEKGDQDGLAEYVAGLSAPLTIKDNFLDYVVTLRKAGLISAPVSVMRAALGNTARLTFDVASRPAAHVLDAVASLWSGHRTLAVPVVDSTLRQAKAALRGVGEGLGMAPDVMRGKEIDAVSRKLEVGKNQRLAPIFGVRREAKRLANIVTRAKAFTPEEIANTPVTPVAEIWKNVWFRLQGVVDKPFRMAAYRASLVEQAEFVARDVEKLKGAQLEARIKQLEAEPTLEMDLQANYDADIATFQNDTSLASAVSGFKRGISQGFGIGPIKTSPHPVLRAGVDLVVPFAKTPSAVVTAASEATPLGFATGGKSALEIRKLMKAVDGKAPPALAVRALQKQMVRQGSRAATGIALIMLGAKWRREGKMTGDKPQGADASQFFSEGKLPFAIKVGGRWAPVTQLQPWAAPLAFGALMAESEDTALGKVAAGFRAAGRLAMETPFLKGTSEAIGGLEGDEGMLRGIMGSGVPNIVAASRRVADPVARREQGFVDALKNRIPGQSEDLLPQIAPTTGEPVRREYSMAARVGELFDPVASSPDRTRFDPILEEVSRVGAAINNPKQKKGESLEAYTERLQEDGRIWNRVMNAFLFPSEETTGLLDDAGVRPQDFDDYHDLRQREQTDAVLEAEAEIIEDVSRRIRSQLSRERRAVPGG